MRQVRIFVTNDDGYDQPGIQHLVDRLVADHGDAVWVLAPLTEHSGASSAVGDLAHNNPVIREVDVPGVAAGQAWAIEGPPALGMLVAHLGALGGKPDLVVSGINPGANMGRAVYHSGTVGAALTARNRGTSGIAVSTLVSKTGEKPEHWTTAAELAAVAAAAMLDDPPAEPLALNINVPDVPLAEVKGARLAEVAIDGGSALLSSRLEPLGDGRHKVIVEYDQDRLDGDRDATDSKVVRAGYASLTWLGRLGHDGPGSDSVVQRIDQLVSP